MKFGIPDAKVRGAGRITDRKTGKVTHFWLGERPAEEPDQTTQPKEQQDADAVDRGA